MGQDQILFILKKNKGKWFCSDDLIKLGSASPRATRKSVSRVVKFRVRYGVRFKKGRFNKSFLRF